MRQTRSPNKLFTQFFSFCAILWTFILFIEWIDIRNAKIEGLAQVVEPLLKVRPKALKAYQNANDNSRQSSVQFWQHRTHTVQERTEQSFLLYADSDHSWNLLSLCLSLSFSMFFFKLRFPPLSQLRVCPLNVFLETLLLSPSKCVSPVSVRLFLCFLPLKTLVCVTLSLMLCPKNIAILVELCLEIDQR